MRKHINQSSHFAAYLQDIVEKGLQVQEGEQEVRPLDQDDKAFLLSVNVFLKAEGLREVKWQEEACIASDFEAQIREKLHYKNLCSLDHAFMHPDEVRSRANNPVRQQNLAGLYAALHRYRLAKDTHFDPQEETLKLWRQDVSLNHDGSYSAHINEAQEIDFNDRIVLIAPGSSTLHDRQDGLASYFQQVELMLGGERIYDKDNSNKTTLYSLTYPYLGRAAQDADIYQTNAAPYEHISPMAQHFVDETLLPSLGVSANSTLSTAQLKQALGKLRLYTISYGSVVIEQVRNAMGKTLLSYGYSKEQLAQAMPQVYVLNNNPVHRLQRNLPETGAFSSVNAVSANDIVSYGHADYGAFVGDEVEQGKEVSGKRINAHTWLNWSVRPVAGINLDKLEAGHTGQIADAKHEAERKRPMYEWEVPRGHLTQLGHHSELTGNTIMSAGKHGQISYHSATPIQNSLRWAVSGKELPEDLTKTFQPCYLVQPSPEERGRHVRRTRSALREREVG